MWVCVRVRPPDHPPIATWYLTEAVGVRVRWGHRRQWIRIIKAKTSRDLALRPIAAAPAVMDAVQKMKKEHRRTVALFQTQIILPSATRASTSS